MAPKIRPSIASKDVIRRAFDYHLAPGHLIRRVQQMAVAVFAEETAALNLTPIQFALLSELASHPDIDQVTLATQIAVDVATLGQVVLRLETRGFLARESDEEDRRRKRLAITKAGKQELAKAIPAVARAQSKILCALSEREQITFCKLLAKVAARDDAKSS